MREYTEEDFTNTSGPDEDPVYVCNGCGYVQMFTLDDMQGDHFEGCSTERIDLEDQRVKDGYYNQDEEEEE